MEYQTAPLINWNAFAEARAGLGSELVRILGYFREDGEKSVADIEAAMRSADAAGLVLPAHTLKGESYQFGAERLGMLAEHIEMRSRHFVETRTDPTELLPHVAGMREVFRDSLKALDNECSPLVERRTFGRKAPVATQMSGFGRA